MAFHDSIAKFNFLNRSITCLQTFWNSINRYIAFITLTFYCSLPAIKRLWSNIFSGSWNFQFPRFFMQTAWFYYVNISLSIIIFELQIGIYLRYFVVGTNIRTHYFMYKYVASISLWGPNLDLFSTKPKTFSFFCLTFNQQVRLSISNDSSSGSNDV